MAFPLNKTLTTEESKYLAKVIGQPLSRCLRDLMVATPAGDPIEWVASWLYKFADSKLYYRQKAQLFDTINKANRALKAEKEHIRVTDERNKLAMKTYKASLIVKLKEAGGKYESSSDVSKRRSIKLDARRMNAAALNTNTDSRGPPETSRGAANKTRHKPPKSNTKRRATFSITPSSSSTNRQVEVTVDAHSSQAGVAMDTIDKDLQTAVSWGVNHRLALVCQHPVLGDLEPRPPRMYPETPAGWDLQGYLPETLYDPEVYVRDTNDVIETWDKIEPMTYRDFTEECPWLFQGLSDKTGGNYEDGKHMSGRFRMKRIQNIQENLKSGNSKEFIEEQSTNLKSGNNKESIEEQGTTSTVSKSTN